MLGTVYRPRPRVLNSVSRAARATCPAPYSQLHGQKDSEITPAPPTGRKVIFSGIQPTGVPHLGNYLGALQQWVRLQDTATPDTKLLFSVVDLHALTVRQDREQLQRWKRETLAALLAIGLDPKRCIVFFQSDVCRTRCSFCVNDEPREGGLTMVQVPAHTELMWILSCTASMGYLSRMTQWKVWCFRKLPLLSWVKCLLTTSE